MKRKYSDELMAQAIPDDDLEAGEEDTEEAKAAALYLRGVRNEAKRLGEVVVSQKAQKIDYSHKQTSYVPKSVAQMYFQQGCYLKIPKELKDASIKRFIELKQMVDRERGEMRKKRRQFDKSQSFIDLMQINPKSALPTRDPDYTEIVSLSEIVVHYAIEPLIKQIKKSKKGASYEYGLWIFALLLVLEKPLVPDVSAELNDLLGVIIECQENFPEQKPTCDLIIVIIAEYFGQRPMQE
eukprot:TRINITY_DN9024_c0_g1_i17.p1 TRINITY_DN9024_c0_g1~~TRINITY_DN9024_c0_g1_i17.p1  ORF type:complete len:239 (+),score=44.38 TRINITY_DN9024_c0_g1_i17:129-845(+)